MQSPHQRMILGFIKRIARQLYLATLVERTLVVVTVLLGGLLLGAGLVPWAQTMPPLIASFALLSWVAVGLATAWLVRGCLHRRSLEAAALYIEAKHPEFSNNLVNALQLPEALEKRPETGISAALVDGLLEVTRRQVEPLRSQSLVDWSGVWQQARVASPLIVATLGVAWLAPQLMTAATAQFLHPFSLFSHQPTVLRLADYPHRVLAGQPLTLQVVASGAMPADVRLRAWQAGKERDEHMLASTPGHFRYTFPHMHEPLRFQAIAGSARSEIGTVDVVAAPAVGNFRVHYQYPEYTRLPPKVEEGTGNIEALAGSEVQIELAANKPVVHGQLIFDDGTQLPLIVDGDGHLQATAIITKPGGYRVQVQDADGFTNQDNLHYRVDVIPDAPPQVDLLAPEADVELDDAHVVTLEYEARDDFGVHNLTLVYRTGNVGEKRLVIDRIDALARRYRGKYYWDVSDLLSEPSQAVTYYLEVWDNDAVSGPKRGVSASHVLRLKSREEEHRNLDELQQQVAGKLVDLLADQLELNSRTADVAHQPAQPDSGDAKELEARQGELQRQAQELVSQLDEMLKMLQKDYLSDYTRYEDTQTLRDTLNFTQDTLMRGARQQLSPQAASPPPPQRHGPRPSRQQPDDSSSSLAQALAKQEAAQAELERMALFAQDIGKRAKMRDVENLAQRMNRTQNNLLDALNDLEKQGKAMDEATREALERELGALEQAMQALTEALSKLPSELPDEFLNSEALQSLPLDDMMQTLQQLRDALQKGSVSEAKRLAEDLLRSMAQMLAALQSAQSFAQSMPFGRQQSAMERSTSELDRIVKEQSEILRDTSGIDKDLRQRINEQQQHAFERLQHELDQTMQGAQRRLQEAMRPPAPLSRRGDPAALSLQRLERTLDQALQQLSPEEAEDLLRSLQSATQELSALQKSPSAAWEDFLQHHPGLQAMLPGLQATLQRAQQELAALNALDGRELLDPQQRDQLGHLGQRQQALQERTDTLKRRLDQLAQFIPFLSPELRQRIGEAGEFMGHAEGELSQRRAHQAMPPEEEALRRLSQGQQAMQQAMQQMAQRGQMGQMPVPMVLRQPGNPFAWNPQPFPDRSPWPQGQMGINTRDFKIPGKEDYKAPRQFREEILEALKRGGPSQFKGQIEQYFKSLTE